MEQLEFDFYKEIIEKLDNGQEVSIIFNGPFMEPLIKSGQTCTISPIDTLDSINVGDIIFKNLPKNNLYEPRTASSLFLVKDKTNKGVLLGNAKNSNNDHNPFYFSLICGKVTKIS